MRLPRSLTVLLLTFCLITTAAGQGQNENDPLTSKVDDLFSNWNKPDSPGAAIAVIKDGAVVYKRGYGSANLEYNIPITPQTVFHVASVSKQFTAFAIVLLANQGKLSLDDDIREHLPEVPDFGKKITIRHLIHHTSGLRDQWTLLGMAGWRLDDVITKEHIMKMVRNQRELNFDPGAENLYSNTGYTLLAVIVERVSGQPFRDFTAANIFKPLGMTNTHFHDDHERIVKNRAYSYYAEGGGGQLKLAALNYANVGATSLFTTSEDLARWLINFGEKRVGGAAVIEQMQQQGILNSGKATGYAFGLGVGPYRGLNTIGHSGGDAAYSSYVYWFPDQKFGVVVLSNFGAINPQQMARRITDIYLADKLAAEQSNTPAQRAAVKLDPAILEAYVGRYLLDRRMPVTISREGDKLMAQPGNQPKAEMTPQSETTFWVRGNNSDVTFERDAKGNVTGFGVKTATSTQSAKRLTSVPATPAQLAEFAGDYYSAELGTTYTFVVKDGKLTAQHRRHDDIQLNELDTELFSGNRWFFQTVQFTRSDDKRITGFRLTSGRVRNLRFDKR